MQICVLMAGSGLDRPERMCGSIFSAINHIFILGARSAAGAAQLLPSVTPQSLLSLISTDSRANPNY